MITLRALSDRDVAVIKTWPPYPQDCTDLDYAVRDNGWLDEYRAKPGTEILVAEKGETIVGFSVLEREPGRQAEFRIAVHPGKIGHGLGKIIALRTLAYGFADPGIDLIRLIVRKNNVRAQRLYASLKFRSTGECIEEVHGKMVAFFRMEISRDTFFEEK